MNGLPPDVDLSFLEGATLIQVSVGENDLILNFDNEAHISVESSISCAGVTGRSGHYDDFRQAVSALVADIGHKILSAKGDEDGTLRLVFETGRVLTLYDDTKFYESYHIQCGERIIVV
jgi:hypothetical protein